MMPAQRVGQYAQQRRACDTALHQETNNRRISASGKSLIRHHRHKRLVTTATTFLRCCCISKMIGSARDEAPSRLPTASSPS
jgi:hypothetical protein